ncbi:MAG: DUF3575 domain-containing protein [Bacteroidota bacterium]
MKKLAIIISVLTLLTSGMQAQKMNNIKTDLLSPFIRTGVVKYERVLNENMSVQLGLFYTGIHPRDMEGSLNGYGITPEFRFYLSETPAPSGTYFAPNVRYMNLTGRDSLNVNTGSYTNLSFAFNVGKQVLLKDVVMIDAWFGPSYNFRNLVDEAGTVEEDMFLNRSGFGLRVGIAIGIAF